MADGDTPLKSTTPIPVPVYGGSGSASSEATAPDAAMSNSALHTAGAGAAVPSSSAAGATPSTDETAEKDVTMTDAPGAANSVVEQQQVASPAPAPATATATAAAPSPAPPARTGTPLRNTTAAAATTNGAESSTSRAASQYPEQGFTMPAEAPAHGAPGRQYLNSKVTTHLLDGMKLLVKDKPKDPLRVLGEFLLQRSKEFETST